MVGRPSRPSSNPWPNMTQFLAHSPILLVFEEECANLLCGPRTYHFDIYHGRQIERLLRAGEISSEARIEHRELIDFMVGERLIALGEAPSRSALTVKDFRDLRDQLTWSRLRLFSVLFAVAACVISLLLLRESLDAFMSVLQTHAWATTLLVLPILLHESIHYFTGRLFGVQGRPGVGLRGWFFLVDTKTFPSLYELPKRQRWVPILAPVVVDSAILFLLLPFRDSPGGAFAVGYYSFAVMWQFLIFLRTDLYVFVATLFNQPRLHHLIWRRTYADCSSNEKMAKRIYWAFFIFSTVIVARIVDVALW
jgi:hypothetical protein